MKYILLFLFLLFFLGMGVAISFFYNYSNDLEKEIIKRDILLMDIKERDSLYEAKTKEYSKVITKYVSDCNFTIGGKQIPTSELLRIVNNALNENPLLKDSLHFYIKAYNLTNEKLKQIQSVSITNNDSLAIYKQMVEIIKNEYGIYYRLENNEKSRYFIKGNMSKADSALLLYPHYKNKLRYDSLNKTWNISIETKIKTTDNLKQKNKK